MPQAPKSIAQSAIKMRANIYLQVIAAIALLVAVANAQSAERRVALVVGNSAYADKPLRNPVNDAELMQRTLKDLGFEVSLLRNADRRALLGGLRDFEARARNADVALFFYAGHGTQVGGSNYLIPLQAQIRAESDVPDEAVDAASVLRRIEDAKARVGLVILDACRDNPYAGASRSSSRGLGRMSVPTGSIVAYAAAPGETADDGKGANGLYTEQLVRNLNQAGLDLREVFDRTAIEVERLTNGKQRPREDVGLRGRFVLKAGPGIQVASVGAEPTGRLPQSDPEEDAWAAAKGMNTAVGYDAYLSEYPKGRYAGAARRGIVVTQLAAVPTTAQQPPTSANPHSGFKDCLDCPEMVVIPAGSFMMGSTQGNVTERPWHEVKIESFAIGRYEVTQGQWKAAMGYNPSRFLACGENCPVESVSWENVQIFIEKLNAKTGQSYRLPSEAEWEYACRSGGSHTYCGGDDVNMMSWYGSGSTPRGNSEGRTHPVGLMRPNPWGLHDMSGNVYEWTQDCWHDNYSGAPSNGSSWVSDCDSDKRVVRGGSWVSFLTEMHSSSRLWFPSRNKYATIGFRLVRNAS